MGKVTSLNFSSECMQEHILLFPCTAIGHARIKVFRVNVEGPVCAALEPFQGENWKAARQIFAEMCMFDKLKGSFLKFVALNKTSKRTSGMQASELIHPRLFSYNVLNII